MPNLVHWKILRLKYSTNNREVTNHQYHKYPSDVKTSFKEKIHNLDGPILII